MESGWRHLVSSFWRRPVASLDRAAGPLFRWFQTPLGRRILNQEIELIEQCRREYRPNHLAQISASGMPLLGRSSRNILRTVISPHLPGSNDADLADYEWITAETSQLPFMDSEIDFLVLHHALEFSEDPHMVLREASRVLAPQGQLLILCFNPWSLLGLRKLLQPGFRTVIPWAHHGLSRGRIADWLKLMGCEPLNLAWGFYQFPIQNQWLLNKTRKLDHWLTQHSFPGGGFYILHASKEVSGWIGTSATKPLKSRLLRFPVAAATRNYKQMDPK